LLPARIPERLAKSGFSTRRPTIPPATPREMPRIRMLPMARPRIATSDNTVTEYATACEACI